VRRIAANIAKLPELSVRHDGRMGGKVTMQFGHWFFGQIGC
jgi:hypothetical protein